MLRRSHRITKNAFDEVMKVGRIVHSPLLMARIANNSKDKGVMIAAVAPVKVAKTAVVRNRTRRRVYEAVRPFTKDIKHGTSIIFFAKQPLLLAKFEDIRSGVKDIFVKAGILR